MGLALHNLHRILQVDFVHRMSGWSTDTAYEEEAATLLVQQAGCNDKVTGLSSENCSSSFGMPTCRMLDYCCRWCYDHWILQKPLSRCVLP